MKLNPYKKRKRADTRTRTGDLFITNELLYQLSHIGFSMNSFSIADAKIIYFFFATKFL